MLFSLQPDAPLDLHISVGSAGSRPMVWIVVTVDQKSTMNPSRGCHFWRPGWLWMCFVWGLSKVRKCQREKHFPGLRSWYTWLYRKSPNSAVGADSLYDLMQQGEKQGDNMAGQNWDFKCQDSSFQSLFPNSSLLILQLYCTYQRPDM